MDNENWKWFHLTTHTYGVWLPGDPRGFRTRHHREHVDGDYKNPPPSGICEERHMRSQELLFQEPVKLPVEWRSRIGQALRERLLELGSEILIVSMSATHAHVLAKTPEVSARDWMGLAKKHAWFVAREAGWIEKLWAKRSHAKPIRDREHQINTFNYILNHRVEGAWVWTFRDEK